MVTGYPLAPKLVFIRALEACNAVCKMCRFAGSVDTYRLSIKALDKLVQELAELGTEEIRFSGGEPTLYAELIEAIRLIRSYGLKASIITNGSNLYEMASDLLDAGITGITCSLDSPRTAIHNTLRGTPELFENATLGLSLFNKLRNINNVPLRLTVNSIVSNVTYDHMDEFIPILEAIGIDTWSLTPIKDVRGLFLDLEQMHVFNEVANKINQRLVNSRVKLNAIQTEIFGTTEEEMMQSASGKAPTYPKCYVPFFIAYIDAKKGTLTACNCLPHRRGRPLSVEGVWDKPFNEIWNDATYVENRQAFAKMAPEYCTGCSPINVRFNKDFSERLDSGSYDYFDWDLA